MAKRKATSNAERQRKFRDKLNLVLRSIKSILTMRKDGRQKKRQRKLMQSLTWAAYNYCIKEKSGLPTHEFRDRNRRKHRFCKFQLQSWYHYKHQLHRRGNIHQLYVHLYHRDSPSLEESISVETGAHNLSEFKTWQPNLTKSGEKLADIRRGIRDFWLVLVGQSVWKVLREK